MKVLEIIKNLTAIQRNIMICILAAVLIGTVGTVTVISTVNKPNKEKEPVKKPDKFVIEIPDEEDPQSVVADEQEEESGAETDISDVTEYQPPTAITLGIDVSKYQGDIDWKKVAAAGIDFAMIRVGHRTLVSGEIVEDATARYNMQQAAKHGIKVGTYFFSTAINEEEAIVEANWVADVIDAYQITYPVAYDCEGFERSGNRQYNMSIEERTDTAVAFLERIAERGYSTMFYGSKSDMEDEVQWDMERISSYNIWVAQYPAVPYPETPASTYSGPHVMWQYTSKGKVPGIKGNVDMDVAYFGYENAKPPQGEEAPEETKPSVEASMSFQDVEEQVTAKDKTNLRDIPSQGAESTVKYTLSNGEIATRTGVSPSGWSRVVFNGNVYYAVSSYLTTDLNYKTPTDDDGDGIKTEFEAVNIQVTPKEAVNLRQKPSVDDTVGPVVVKIENGVIVTKTGVSKNGWARVVYEGQTLYCIDSYLKEVAQ